jgi:segregation and condensation protein A
LSEIETGTDTFEDVTRVTPISGDTEPHLVVDVDGYEGPLDVLLTLARTHKVDLKKLSILALADQYLAFIQQARSLHLEIAADYLVMAAWLAYLKSRLLLPDDPNAEEPSGEEMSAILAFHLQRLEAMRDAAARLMARHRLGRDVFKRGAPEGIRVIRKSVYELSLYELLKGYVTVKSRVEVTNLRITPPPVYSLERAMERLRSLIGDVPDWATLESFLEPEFRVGKTTRSAIASTLVASLELARQGTLELLQSNAFGPIYFRKKRGDDQ